MVSGPRHLKVVDPLDQQQDQEQLVETWLEQNPWSTIPAIRAGIESDTGILVERVQGRLQSIGKRRLIQTRPADHGRKAYFLGGPAVRRKGFGVEARVLLEDGEIKVDVSEQKCDLTSDELADLQTQLSKALRGWLEARAVPLAEAAARAEGLLGLAQEEPEDGWLATLTAYQED